MYPTLSLDYGTKRIGVAVSDDKGIIATPLDTLSFSTNTGIEEIVLKIKSLIEEYRVKSILVGMPQEFTQSNSVNTKRITDFINTLKKRINLSIETYDESFSTSTAKDMLLSSGQHFKKNKSRIDSLAASVFLQEYLNSKNNQVENIS